MVNLEGFLVFLLCFDLGFFAQVLTKESEFFEAYSYFSISAYVYQSLSIQSNIKVSLELDSSNRIRST